MASIFNVWIWLAIPIGLAALIYGGGPLLILLIFKNEAQPTLQPFEPSDQSLPLLVREHFKNACDELMPLGFEYIAGMRLPQMTDNVMAIMIMLVNRSAGDAAAAISIYAKSDEVWDLQTSYVEYSTSFRSGVTVNTQNSTAISAFPPLAECKNYRFSSIRDARQLYQVHERLLSEQNASPKLMRLDEEYDGDAVAFVRAVLHREMVGAASDGYLYLTADSKYFRATLKGAYLMTWQELCPIKQIRRSSRDRQARQQLVELGFPSK
ncbi:MAG: hypothetical protein QF918_10470 [Pirellulaceae bacterium]|nr:hypothetical protein [Pirellulaceae bacterium]